MIPRSGPRLPVLSPGRLFAFGDPQRRQECFLTEVSSNGLQVRTNFALPIDDVVGMELETHLVLVDVRNCQLRHGKFWIGVERRHAIPIAALDAALTVEGPGDGDARQIARLLVLLESFLQEPGENPSRRVMSQTRAAYGKLLTVSALLACGQPPADVAAKISVDEEKIAIVHPGAELTASVTVIAEAIPALQNVDEEASERTIAGEFEAVSDRPEPIVEVVDVSALREPASAAHVPFVYSVPVDLAVAHRVPPSVQPADWIYHFVPSPKAPIVPDLNDAAKGLIEALHAAA